LTLQLIKTIFFLFSWEALNVQGIYVEIGMYVLIYS
jgi:hypothetical protein